MKNKSLILILLLFFLTSCNSFSDDIIIEPDTNEDLSQIVVYISGEINVPGVYMMNKNSLLMDLVKSAGGFTSKADVNNVNLVKPLEPNEMIIIPRMNDDALENKEKININTASLEELMTLPTFGEAKAKLVIDYRKNHGPFHKIEDIKKVNTIKDATFEKIKDYITV